MKRLSDFAPGDSFEVAREVDAYRPIYYAAVSGDFNPIHIDHRMAKAAGLGSVILHGMCTFSWLADACGAYFGDPARVRRVRARFSKPVLVGDRLTLRGRCVAVDGRTVRVEVSAVNQAGDEVLKGATAEAFVEEGA